MSYTQLSTAERNRLYELKTTTSLSLHAISSERHTRSEEGYYLPDRAQQRMQKRRHQSETAFSQV